MVGPPTAVVSPAPRPFAFLCPSGPMRTILLIVLASLFTAVGEAFLSKGMKETGDVAALPRGQLWKMVFMFGNPKVLVGILFLAVFFFIYSAALSWADLSYLMPATALSFVFGALIAWLFLGERVSGWRWAGIGLISLGITLVWMGERQRPAFPGNSGAGERCRSSR